MRRKLLKVLGSVPHPNRLTHRLHLLSLVNYTQDAKQIQLRYFLHCSVSFTCEEVARSIDCLCPLFTVTLLDRDDFIHRNRDHLT